MIWILGEDSEVVALNGKLKIKIGRKNDLLRHSILVEKYVAHT